MYIYCRCQLYLNISVSSFRYIISIKYSKFSQKGQIALKRALLQVFDLWLVNLVLVDNVAYVIITIQRTEEYYLHVLHTRKSQHSGGDKRGNRQGSHVFFYWAVY